MSRTTTLSASQPPDPTLLAKFAAAIPRRSDGQVKKRLTLEEKFHALDPQSPSKATEKRLEEFQELFAFRRKDAIITKAGQGPRAWTALKGPLYLDHVARHLLADRLLPALEPQWVGARSLNKTRFVCIDVDADRETSTGTAPCGKSRPPFVERCKLVEQTLRRMGVNPGNPRHLLLQTTPSGGRHYFLFLDATYNDVAINSLWETVGLRDIPGQIELFPKESKGLRLPFGHIPGRPHDPVAWVQFIDDYHNKHIRRFSLDYFYDKFAASHRSRPTRAKAPPPAPSTPGATLSGGMGVPKRFLQHFKLKEGSVERYRQLVEHGPQSRQEAEELMSLGILLPGTRNRVLNHLAQHLVWFRGLDAEQAGQVLTAWAMNPRHLSKDIRADLERGTDHVARQIGYLCRWCETHSRTSEQAAQQSPNGPLFALAELTPLRTHVEQLPTEARLGQAQFYLHFLRFAKAHGHPAPEGAGWEAAPAVARVIRRWPGCNHRAYKTWMENATTAGLFRMTRQKWQRKGGNGRARTYLLAVQVVPRDTWTISLESALSWLVNAVPAGVDGMLTKQSTTVVIGATTNDGVRDNESGRIDERGCHPIRTGATDPPAVPEASSRGHLDQNSRERPAEQDAVARLHDSPDGDLDPVPEPAEELPVRGRADKQFSP